MKQLVKVLKACTIDQEMRSPGHIQEVNNTCSSILFLYSREYIEFLGKEISHA